MGKSVAAKIRDGKPAKKASSGILFKPGNNFGKATRFQKGRSGNPLGGNVGGMDLVRSAKERARDEADATIDRLIYWRDQDERPDISLGACFRLLEYALGKPRMEGELKDPKNGLTNDAKARLIAKLNQLLERGAEIPPAAEQTVEAKVLPPKSSE